MGDRKKGAKEIGVPAVMTPTLVGAETRYSRIWFFRVNLAAFAVLA